MAGETRSASLDRCWRRLQSWIEQPVARTVLPNGLVTLVKEDRTSPVVSIQFWVRSGSMHEGAHLGTGLSHFLEHMLFKGTTKRSGKAYAAAVQALGGYVNAYTTFDRTVYYLDLPSENFAAGAELLADAVFNSTLPAAEIGREREVILREIDMGQDDPDQRLAQAFFETAFREHPYRYPIIGHRELFESADRAMLAAYYHERYAPNNVVAVVAGDVAAGEASAVLEKILGPIPRRRVSPVLVPSEPGQLGRRESHRYEDVQLFRASLGFHTPPLTHPDSPALDVLAIILGHGNSSLLWNEVRERAGLVHEIDVSNWNPGAVGLFYVGFLAEPEKGEAALRRTLAYLQAGPGKKIRPALVEKAVRKLLSGEISARKTMSGQASRIGAAEVVAGDLDFSRHYLRRVAQLTPADCGRVWRSWLCREQFTCVTSRPASARPAAAAVAAGAAAEPEFSEQRLGNGARLLWRQNPALPNLHFRFVGRGGAGLEPADQRGITQLLAVLLTRDTKKRSAAAVATAIESVGGGFGQFAGNNSFGLSLEVLPDDAPLALSLLEEALLAPAFKPSTVAREREAQLASIREAEDDIVSAAQLRLREHFFGSHPLAVDASGTLETVARLSPAALRAHHARLVTGANAVLAVSGDFSGSGLLGKVRRLLEKLPPGRPLPEAAPLVQPASPGAHRFPRDRQQAVVMLGFRGPGVVDEDFILADIAEELLSGLSSRLFERVRDKLGLAYFVRSGRIIGMRAGCFYLVAGTHPAAAPRVLKEMRAELARLRAGRIPAAEWERCRTRLKAGRRMSLQTNGACAVQAGLNAAYGLPVNDWRHYGKKIDACRPADLARFARHWLVDTEAVELVAGAAPEAITG
ncbi:MAG: insulinase family protein [Puniceicoccaceae bacterium]|nr:MAG: insulinase family protein [Puniceicoccaceae bacterium]